MAGVLGKFSLSLVPLQRLRPLAALALALLATVATAVSEARDSGDSSQVPGASTDVLGEVSFPVSCDPAVQPAFNDATATLHSFEFAEARAMFEEIAAQDADCAMAHWGIAETYYHPLWAPPSREDLTAGAAAARKAQSLEKTEREALYVDAIAAFYREHESIRHDVRAQRYEEAMADAHEQLPEDPEAEIFYALAKLSNVDPTDKTYVVQKQVGAMLEPLFEEMPRHPGVTHYIIHAYDYPLLAQRAEQAAHRYLDIAASLPHALHMSGHIFTQLGMWEDSIEANARSAEAARERGEQGSNGSQAQLNEMHALDYLVYAHLQRGDNEQARRIVDLVREREDLNWSNWVVAYNAGAILVRWVLERHEWEEAASIPSLEVQVAEGSGYTGRMAVALRHWTATLGAARSGQVDKAEAQLAELEGIAASLQESGDVWARNTSEVLRREAAAWLALARGNEDQALELMHSAAALEDETDKSGLSPGRPLPSHEMLADMLMQLGRHEQALAEYRTSLEHAPRRYNSILGAARAAAETGRPDVAGRYYEKLLDLAVTDSARPGVEEARDYLQGAQS